MTRDEVLKLAAECGFEHDAYRGLEDELYAAFEADILKLCQEVENRAYERAADVAEGKSRWYAEQSERLDGVAFGIDSKVALVGRDAAQDCANDIRALKPKQDTQ
jgi:hypothetical protein